MDLFCWNNACAFSITLKKVTGHGRLVDENTKISGFVFFVLFLKKFRFLKNSLYNNEKSY